MELQSKADSIISFGMKRAEEATGLIVMHRGSLVPRNSPDERQGNSRNRSWHDSFDAWQAKTVTFKPEQDGEIDILCEVKAPGCVQFDHIALDTVKEPVPPLELLFNAPFSFRDGVYSSNRGEKTFSGELLNNGVPEAMQLILTFQDREYPLKKHGAAYPFTLDVPSRIGEYPIVVRALDRQGKKIAEITRKFRVNAPAEPEASFRKDHVMLIDGEPFFPLGVWGVDGRKTTAEKAEILADAGFNTARCAADQIDDFASAGLMVLMKVPESQSYGQRAFRTLGQDVPERNAEISEAPFPDRLLQYG
ncbi:MAG: hypothetical protein V8T87_07220 [Victivallales bacterium]